MSMSTPGYGHGHAQSSQSAQHQYQTNGSGSFYAPLTSPLASSFNVNSIQNSLNQIADGSATSSSQQSPTYNNGNMNNAAASTSASTSGGQAAPAQSARPANRNPLIDLIETEREYVDEMAMIIKKVAAAWSRSNFPPPALDTMFRAVEAVYRTDKQFMAKLNEIGPKPSSPKALGDLLMRWIDELEPAYTRYVNTFQGDFDNYAPVQSNPNLLPILQGLPPLASTGSSTYPTLDALFYLPLQRLEYYKKLYAKLLKATQPGKSDHGLLVGANEKLDRLLQIGQESAQRRVGAEEDLTPTTSQVRPASADKRPAPPQDSNEVAGPSGRAGSDRTSNSSSSVERSSGQTSTSTASTNLTSDTSARNTATSSSLLADIEGRLDTSKTLDIFTMRFKKCKLQINPPNLTYQRLLRHGADVQVSFVPASDPQRQEIYTPTAYIFLLTDLFLLCERIPSPQTEANKVNPDADMWLTYPPLATKHLRVTPLDENAFEVEIMKKERMTIFAESIQAKELWLNHFREAISFAGPSQSLRVNTDINRSTSPASVTSAASMRPAAFSPQSWQSSGSDQTISPLPPLPMSASTSNFPASPARSPSPQPPLSRPFEQGHPHDCTNGRASPARPPQNMRPLPSPTSNSSFLNQQQNIPPQNWPHPAESSSSFQPPQNPRSPHHPVDPNYQQYGRGPPPMPEMADGHLRKLPSVRSMTSASSSSRSSKASQPNPGMSGPMPPLPNKDPYQAQYAPHGPVYQGDHGRSQPDMRNGGLLSPSGSQPGQMGIHRSKSAEGLRQQEQYRMPSSVLKEQLRGNSLPSHPRQGYPPSLPPSMPGSRMNSGHMPAQDDDDISPPSSPKFANVTSQLAAQMKCKVFIQQAKGQWKSLGTSKLKLYLQSPSNQKQLVVEGEKAILISTIVLEDGVERVGKTGVAIELSDNGSRTGIVYMLQLKTEQSATGLFGQLIMGSSRASAAVSTR